MKNAYYYETIIGRVFIADDGQGITDLRIVPEESIYGQDASCATNTSYIIRETGLISEAAGQLKEYLSGNRRHFDVKLNPAGTAFRKSVWEALKDIPYGEVRSYAQIAEAIGNPKACRAVGMANHNNPIICMIPCHRVIGADGSLTGYAGGLNVKKQLLMLEQGKGVTEYE